MCDSWVNLNRMELLVMMFFLLCVVLGNWSALKENTGCMSYSVLGLAFQGPIFVCCTSRRFESLSQTQNAE